MNKLLKHQKRNHNSHTTIPKGVSLEISGIHNSKLKNQGSGMTISTYMTRTFHKPPDLKPFPAKMHTQFARRRRIQTAGGIGNQRSALYNQTSNQNSSYTRGLGRNQSVPQRMHRNNRQKQNGEYFKTSNSLNEIQFKTNYKKNSFQRENTYIPEPKIYSRPKRLGRNIFKSNKLMIDSRAKSSTFKKRPQRPY